MANAVGLKGQVVIEKEIRDRLGIQPGWQTVQMLVDGRVEMYFLPPEHRRSLKGCLKVYVHPSVACEDSWDDLVTEAAGVEFRERNPGSSKP